MQLKRAGRAALMLVAALASGSAAAQSLWWTQPDGLHALDIASGVAVGHRDDVPAAVLVDPVAIWRVQDTQVRRTVPGEGTTASAAIPSAAGSVTRTASDGAGGLWIARTRQLVHVDASLAHVRLVTLSAAVDALAAAGPAMLWLATGDRIIGLDREGRTREHRTLALPDDAGVLALHVDPASGVLWVVSARQAMRLDALDGLRELSRVELPDVEASALDTASGDLWTVGPRGLSIFDTQGTTIHSVAAPSGSRARATAVLPDVVASRAWVSDAHGVTAVALDAGHWSRIADEGPAVLADRAAWVAPSVEVLPDDAGDPTLVVTPSCRPDACRNDARYAGRAEVRIAIDGRDATARLTRNVSGTPALALSAAEARNAAVLEVTAVDAYGNSSERQVDLRALKNRAAQKANLPPVVSITAPPSNATAIAPAAFTITANASDPDGTVARVEFYRNGVLLGTDATAPYAWAWSNVAAGTYSLTAKAYDNAGAIGTSAPVSVQVRANVAPTVTLTSPPNNASFVAPATVTLSAAAADSDGSIARVDFLRGGSTLIGTVTAPPFTYTWSGVAAGTYSLTAKATDDKGAATTSAAVTAKVNNPPGVSVTAPANNAVFVAPTPITIQASATDTDGTVAKVEFFQNGTLLGSDSTSPYSYAWANPSIGNYSLTAKATDNLGATRISAPIAISVRANQPPVVALTAPAADLQRVAGTTLALAATASDPDGTITRVDFRLAGAVMATDTSAPYTGTLVVPLGAFPVTATAIDNKGAPTVSSAVMLTGVANQLPAVTLDAPLDGQVFPSATPPDVTLSATARDADGAVTRVRFMAITHLTDLSQSAPFVIATVAQPPYTAVWHAVPFTVNPLVSYQPDPEYYEVWAEADDDAGGTGTSSTTAAIRVPNASPWSIAIAAPGSGASYVPPATIVVVGVPANAASGTGDAIAKVELIADGAGVATLTNANGARGEYVFAWRGVPAGPHDLALRLTDAAGFSVTSAPTSIDVRAPDRFPAVSLIAPAGMLSVPAVPASPVLALAANASDPDGTLAGVDFLDNGSTVATVTAPFTSSWSAPVGVHALRARARDDRGYESESPPAFVNVLVAERSPVVAITAPAPGGAYRAGAPLVLAADAIAPDGVISRVDFVYAPLNNVIGSASSAPYRYTWTPPAGTYSIRAIATTVTHGVSASAPLTLTISSNSAPVVTLTSPRDAQVYAVGLPVALAATASDPDGTIAKVEFLVNGAVVSTRTSAPYMSSWTPASAGSVAIAARATDNAGAVAVSSIANITVLAAAASIAITAPSANAVALAGQPLSITAQAVMPGRTIARVDFLVDGAAIGSVAAPGAVSATIATLAWAAPLPGPHVLGARTVATDGTTLTAPAVSVQVSDFTLALVEPYAGETFLAPGDIRIVATPSSSGSPITRVDFVGDGVVLGSATTQPYLFVWRGMGVGSHTVSVRATNAAGLAVSATANVHVVATPVLTVDAGIDGSSLADDAAGITGTLLAPRNAALIINGRLAALDPQGRFFLDNLLLTPGINRVVLMLNTLDAPPVQQIVTLNSTAPGPFVVDLSPQEGFAPHVATLSIRNRTATAYARVEIDANDDGTRDQTVVSAAGSEIRIAYTLPSPGLYPMRVTVYDASNHVVYQARRQARVYDRAELGRKVVGAYWSMLDRLAGNDPAAALRAFTADAQDRYADVFAALGGGIVAVAAELRRVVDGVVGEDIAELTHARDTPGGPALFMIYLVRGRDGLWRIETM